MPSSPLYFVEVEGTPLGRYARWFLELDREDNSAGAVRCFIRHDGSRVVKVLEVNEDEGTCRDVTEDMRREALAGVVPDPEPVDRQAQAWDHRRDERKHATPASYEPAWP
jgi:hypothetical protein